MSVIADFYGVNGRFPVKVGGVGTTVKYFPRLLGSSIGAVPATPSATNSTGMLLVPGDDKLNAQQFNVRATGIIGTDTGDPSGTAAITLYFVTGSYTAPQYFIIGEVDAFVPGFALGQSWALKAQLYGDSVSGLVGGSFESWFNGGNYDGPDNSESVISGINFNGGNSGFGLGSAVPFGLVVGVTFGTSDATNSASMYQFQITTD